MSFRTKVALFAPALLLALACSDASALIHVAVHADFPAAGFADGAVWGSNAAQAFDVSFVVDETAAVRHLAGFEVKPGAVVLGHDVYAFGYDAIVSASSFSFGNQVFNGMSMHNLSFALLDGGVIAAPLFLSAITPGAPAQIEVGLAPGFFGLGSYDFSPLVPGTLQTAFLTDVAQAWDGHAQAYGTVSVSISAVPEPAGAALLLSGLLTLALALALRRSARPAPPGAPAPGGASAGAAV